MKQSIGIILCLLMAWGTRAQTSTVSQSRVSRIDFREKANNHLRSVPTELLRAFCEGRIDAYFPMAPTQPVSYSDFLAHFQISQPQPFINESINACNKTQCPSLDPAFTRCFEVYLDILENDRTDKQSAVSFVEKNYVRLVFPGMYTRIGAEFFGPMFRIEDFKKLAYIRITNPKNDRSPFTLAQIFSSKLYTSVIMSFPEATIEKPAVEDIKNQDKRLEKRSFDEK